jgi:hypothetical protein
VVVFILIHGDKINRIKRFFFRYGGRLLHRLRGG